MVTTTYLLVSFGQQCLCLVIGQYSESHSDNGEAFLYGSLQYFGQMSAYSVWLDDQYCVECTRTLHQKRQNTITGMTDFDFYFGSCSRQDSENKIIQLVNEVYNRTPWQRLRLLKIVINVHQLFVWYSWKLKSIMLLGPQSCLQGSSPSGCSLVPKHKLMFRLSTKPFEIDDTCQ